MGNTPNTPFMDTIDVVYTMEVAQRLEYLIHGYLRMHYNVQKDKHFPSDISTICIKYTGITKYNQYNLIKSNTELKMEQEEREKEARKRYPNADEINERNAERSLYTLHSAIHGDYAPEIKVCLLGDGGVGKSALNIRFVRNDFLEEYDPTIEDRYRKQTEVDGHKFVWDILDTAGQDDFASLRNAWIRECHVFIFVYDITRRSSFEALGLYINDVEREKDASEDAWFGVIVGNKIDLEYSREVGLEEGRAFGEQFDNMKFFEISVKQKIQSEEPFNECARWYMHASELYQKQQDALNKKSDKSCSCKIL